MSAEQNVSVFRRLIEEGFDQGNVELLDECLSSTYIEHQLGLPTTRAEFKGAIRNLRHAFADFSIRMEGCGISES